MTEIGYTRDVSDKMIKELKTGVFKPFVDYVREHKDGLALCFRGSNPKAEKVIVYRHNFMIWELFFQEQIPCVTINLDLARFMEHWDVDVAKALMDKGFRGPKNMDYNQTGSSLVYRIPRNSKKENNYEYHALDLTYELKIEGEVLTEKEEKEIATIVDSSYKILSNALDVYLTRIDPINFIKKYYYDKVLHIENDNCKSRRQRRTEKRVQQEIFTLNHRFENGLFVYDLEFHQPDIKGRAVPKSNEPDMLGVRFEKDQLVSICFIEVKSTKNAIKGKHGVVPHLIGMQEYIQDRKDLVEDRKKEACRILNQYKEIGLYGVKKKYNEDYFKKLKEEIIFVFTNELDLDSEISETVMLNGDTIINPTIREILIEHEHYEKYSEMKYGHE